MGVWSRRRRVSWEPTFLDGKSSVTPELPPPRSVGTGRVRTLLGLGGGRGGVVLRVTGPGRGFGVVFRITGPGSGFRVSGPGNRFGSVSQPTQMYAEGWSGRVRRVPRVGVRGDTRPRRLLRGREVQDGTDGDPRKLRSGTDRTLRPRKTGETPGVPRPGRRPRSKGFRKVVEGPSPPRSPRDEASHTVVYASCRFLEDRATELLLSSTPPSSVPPPSSFVPRS